MRYSVNKIHVAFIFFYKKKKKEAEMITEKEEEVVHTIGLVEVKNDQ